MASAPVQLDVAVTEEKILAAIDRIVAVANPLQIIAFGSRARGDFRPSSDLDLAVIVDHLEPGAGRPVKHSNLSGIVMPVDLLVFDRETHERRKPWPGSVHHEIGREGVILYDHRSTHGVDRGAVTRLVGR